jgi:hypothetical protein
MDAVRPTPLHFGQRYCWDDRTVLPGPSCSAFQDARWHGGRLKAAGVDHEVLFDDSPRHEMAVVLTDEYMPHLQVYRKTGRRDLFLHGGGLEVDDFVQKEAGSLPRKNGALQQLALLGRKLRKSF